MKRTLKRNTRVRFPNRLWRYRRRTGFSQQEVAELAGYLTPSEISRFERGERLPSLLMALKLEVIYRTGEPNQEWHRSPLASAREPG